MKLLVDTDIIIDALTGREPFREDAEQIFLLAANQTEDMYITVSSAIDICYIVRKHLHSTEQANSCCAKRNRIDYIVTRNKKDYEKSRVHAILPDEFIKMISQDE